MIYLGACFSLWKPWFLGNPKIAAELSRVRAAQEALPICCWADSGGVARQRRYPQLAGGCHPGGTAWRGALSPAAFGTPSRYLTSTNFTHRTSPSLLLFAFALGHRCACAGGFGAETVRSGAKRDLSGKKKKGMCPDGFKHRKPVTFDGNPAGVCPSSWPEARRTSAGRLSCS